MHSNGEKYKRRSRKFLTYRMKGKKEERKYKRRRRLKDLRDEWGREKRLTGANITMMIKILERERGSPKR
jgi:hypothetical protein